MATTSKPINQFSLAHGAVLLAGLLVFVLLLIADKTNLDNDAESAMGGRSGDGGKTATVSSPGIMQDLASMLPPADNLEGVAQLRTALDAEKDPTRREELFQQVVEGFSKEGRLDWAGLYAAAYASESPSSRNFVVAAALFRNAALQPQPQADSLLFRRLSDEAVKQAESALELEPENEDAKLELGLALVESRIPGNSMQGIFKIREVAEKNPKNTEALLHLGKFSLETNQNDKAAQRFKQMLEVNPEDPRAKYYLAITESRLGNSAEFKRLMSEVATQTIDAGFAEMAKAALSENP
jgi:tetratricopeptide (TPR) repeat protein